MLLLYQSGLLPPTVATGMSASIGTLAFGHPAYLCPARDDLLAFYDLILPSGARVAYDPDCTATSAQYAWRGPALILEFPPMYLQEGRGDTFDWPVYFQNCRAAPFIGRRMALSRFSNIEPASSVIATIVVRRDARDLVNVGEVESALRAPHLHVRKVALDTLPWQEQVQLVMTSDSLICYSGAAVGSHEVWLPPGAVLIQFDFARAWYCTAAYCAAAHPARDILFVISTPRDAGNAFGLNAWNLSFGSFRAFETASGMGRAMAATTPHAHLGLPFYGPTKQAWEELHHSGRVVGLRAIHGLVSAFNSKSREPSLSLASTYHAWAEDQGDDIVLDACAGAAVQVYE